MSDQWSIESDDAFSQHRFLSEQVRWRSLQLSTTAGDCLLVEHPGTERNFLRHCVALEDFQGVIDRFSSTSGILESGIQDTLLHIGDAFLGQSVDSDEFHVFLPSRRLGGEIGTMRARI